MHLESCHQIVSVIPISGTGLNITFYNPTSGWTKVSTDWNVTPNLKINVIFWHWIQKCNFYSDRVKGVQNSPLKQICPAPLISVNTTLNQLPKQLRSQQLGRPRLTLLSALYNGMECIFSTTRQYCLIWLWKQKYLSYYLYRGYPSMTNKPIIIIKPII